jgi:hypothetical protein
MILAFLLRRREAKKEAIPISWVSRQCVYEQVWPFYTPSRTKKTKPGDPPVINYKKGYKPAAEMSHATFSGFMGTLRDAGLIEEEYLRIAGKRKPTGLMMPGRLPSGSFPILPPTHWSKPCWRFPEHDRYHFFVSF